MQLNLRVLLAVFTIIVPCCAQYLLIDDTPGGNYSTSEMSQAENQLDTPTSNCSTEDRFFKNLFNQTKEEFYHSLNNITFNQTDFMNQTLLRYVPVTYSQIVYSVTGASNWLDAAFSQTNVYLLNSNGVWWVQNGVPENLSDIVLMYPYPIAISAYPGSNNFYAVMGSGGAIYTYWQELLGGELHWVRAQLASGECAKDIAVGGDGNIWIISCTQRPDNDYVIKEYSSVTDSFTETDNYSSGVAITADSSGTPCTTNSAGTVCCLASTPAITWNCLDGVAKYLSTSNIDTTMWQVGTSNYDPTEGWSPYLYRPTGWDQATGLLNRIFVYQNDLFLATDLSNDFWIAAYS